MKMLKTHKTLDQDVTDCYIELLDSGQFVKARRLQPRVDVDKKLWNKYLEEWRKVYAMLIM
jgi:hypothetical protein